MVQFSRKNDTHDLLTTRERFQRKQINNEHLFFSCNICIYYQLKSDIQYEMFFHDTKLTISVFFFIFMIYYIEGRVI